MRNYNDTHPIDRYNYPVLGYDWYSRKGAPLSVLRALAAQKHLLRIIDQGLLIEPCTCSECYPMGSK